VKLLKTIQKSVNCDTFSPYFKLKNWADQAEFSITGTNGFSFLWVTS